MTALTAPSPGTVSGTVAVSSTCVAAGQPCAKNCCYAAQRRAHPIRFLGQYDCYGRCVPASRSAVVSIEASRLARNGRDWYTLLEFCGLVGTLIVDEDGVYDPRHPNDRVLLGMKGTMSEIELSIFRSTEAEGSARRTRRSQTAASRSYACGLGFW